MAPQPKITNERFIDAYGKCTSIRELAKKLKVSIPTAYKYCRTNELELYDSSTRMSMRAFTDDELIRARQKAKTARELAERMDVSLLTLRRHLQRLGISFERRATITPEQTQQIFDSYKGQVTIRDLAAHFNMTMATIRAALDRETHNRWADARGKIALTYPRPSNHSEIKIHHALVSVGDRVTVEMLREFSVPEDIASSYLARWREMQ